MTILNRLTFAAALVGYIALMVCGLIAAALLCGASWLLDDQPRCPISWNEDGH